MIEPEPDPPPLHRNDRGRLAEDVYGIPIRSDLADLKSPKRRHTSEHWQHYQKTSP